MNIRVAREADFEGILGMIKELAAFEQAAHKVSNSVDQMLAEKEHFRCFVAEDEDGNLVGMALYFFAYYTWAGKSLYLDDLYVKPEWRGKGLGLELLKRVFAVAEAEGCKRVRWQVLEWNANAIAFYKKAGAKLDQEWITCQFDEVGIAGFAK